MVVSILAISLRKMAGFSIIAKELRLGSISFYCYCMDCNIVDMLELFIIQNLLDKHLG